MVPRLEYVWYCIVTFIWSLGNQYDGMFYYQLNKLPTKKTTWPIIIIIVIRIIIIIIIIVIVIVIWHCGFKSSDTKEPP